MTALMPPCEFYVISALGEPGYHVVCRSPAHPTWLRILAWFENEERAESYAEVEYDMAADADSRLRDLDEAPPVMPAPGDPIKPWLHVRELDRLEIERLARLVHGIEVADKTQGSVAQRIEREGPSLEGAGSTPAGPTNIESAPGVVSGGAAAGEVCSAQPQPVASPAVSAPDLTPGVQPMGRTEDADSPSGYAAFVYPRGTYRMAGDEALIRLAREGKCAREIGRLLKRRETSVKGRAKRLGLTLADGRKRRNGKPQRRFESHPELDPESVEPLPADHPAIVSKRTMFPKSVVDADESDRLLVSGANSRKLGDRVVKGEWAGMPLYYLTLEERATCPESCHHYGSCYGNAMPFARRHRHGPEFERVLDAELAELQGKHRKGFVVRLHNLGDFYSVDYVGFWAGRLRDTPALRVFGYTAWPKESEIGAGVERLNAAYADRWFIRFSSEKAQPGGATTIWRKPEGDRVPEGIVCPAQTDKTACCGSCGLCWSLAAREKIIVFIAHGKGKAGRKPKPADVKANIAAAAKLPKNAGPAALEMPAPVDHDHLQQAVERRCVGCQKIFKTSIVTQARCRDCESGGSGWSGEDRATLRELVNKGWWAREIVAALDRRHDERDIYTEARRLNLKWQGTKKRFHDVPRLVGAPKLPADVEEGERA